MTTRPVLRSTAITDQVADAADGSDRSANRTRTTRRIQPPLQFADGVADPHGAGTHDTRIDTTQVQPLALGRVDDLHRVPAEALDKLRTAGVRLRGDLDPRLAHRQPRARRQVGLAE